MRSIFVFIPAFFAIFGSASGIDFSTLFGTVKNATNTNRAIATQCAGFKNRRRCKLNANNLKLDVGGSIELVVKPGGRTIKCDNKLAKGKGKWYGNCDGDADDANFIKLVDKNGTANVFGSIRVGSDVCQIAPSLNGESEIICIPESEFLPEGLPIEAPPKKFPERLRNLKFGFNPSFNDTDAENSPLKKARGNARRQLYDDSGSNVDILVVWTKEAECRNAGLPVGCTVTEQTANKMRGLIQLAVSETNTAYQLSGILSALRLVHSYRDPDYIEKSFSASLNDLTNEADGFLDSVHIKRALYGADIVHMIVGKFLQCRTMVVCLQ
jgi:hypothetical protein